MEKQKVKCRWCGKSTGEIKYYTIADDLENPKPYHHNCIKEMYIQLYIDMAREKDDNTQQNYKENKI
jgi:hypothetical protein